MECFCFIHPKSCKMVVACFQMTSLWACISLGSLSYIKSLMVWLWRTYGSMLSHVENWVQLRWQWAWNFSFRNSRQIFYLLLLPGPKIRNIAQLHRILKNLIYSPDLECF